MRKSTLAVSLVCILLIIAVASNAVAQRKGPAAQALTLKKINVPSSIYRLVSIDDLYLLNGKKGIILGVELRNDGYRLLHSMRLKQNGKLKVLDTLKLKFEGRPLISLVWTEGTESPAKPTGLLFICDDNFAEDMSTLYFTKLSTAGRFTQKATKLFEVPFPLADGEIGCYGLGAKVGPSSVAVASTYSVFDSDTGNHYLVGRFFETGFGGKMIGGVREIPFDKKMKMWGWSGRPEWTGKRWLVPVMAKGNNPDATKCYVATADSSVKVLPASVASIKVSQVFKGGTGQTVTEDTCFIPEPGSAGTPGTAAGARLLINVSTDIGAMVSKLDEPCHCSFIQPFTSKGRKLKQTTTVPFNGWARVYQVQPNYKFNKYSEYLSDFIIGGNGDLIVARGDALWGYLSTSPSPSEYSFPGRVILMSIDEQYKVKEIAQSELPTDDYPDTFPILKRYGDKYWIIIRANIAGTGHENYYLSIHGM